MTRFLGVDLAWGSGTPTRAANETGLVVLGEQGNIIDAGWARGASAVLDWILDVLEPGDVIAIDAPLVVINPSGQRLCEKETGARYMYPWKVAANSSNLARKDLAGVTLRLQLEAFGVSYVDGLTPYDGTSVMFECYPFTTIVGTAELNYDVRPQYKRAVTRLQVSERRAFRAAECDELIRRVATLADATTPMDLRSHPITNELVVSPSPQNDRDYKHREDLLDAALAAWTAALWATQPARVQILGATARPDDAGRRPTIVAPAKPAQRR